MPYKDRFVVKEVSEAAVHKELTNLKRKKATDIDNLPPGMLKDTAPILAKPLTFLINLSLKTGIVPTDWKVANVIPLHKSGSYSTKDNYRPILVLPTLSKILEKVNSLWLTLKKAVFSSIISLDSDQSDPLNKQ